MSFLTTTDPILALVRGDFKNRLPLNKFGRSPDTGVSAALPKDIHDAGTLYQWNTTEQTHALVSTALNDSAAGTGLRKVQVVGLSGKLIPIDEEVTLNGIGAVNTTKSFFRIYRLKGLEWGSAGRNVGTITATGTVDGFVTAQIGLTTGRGNGQTQMAIFTTGRYDTFYLKSFYGGVLRSGGDAAVELELWVRNNCVGSTSGWRNIQPMPVHSKGDNPMQHVWDPYLKIEPATDMIVSVSYASANNLVISAGFDGEIERASS